MTTRRFSPELDLLIHGMARVAQSHCADRASELDDMIQEGRLAVLEAMGRPRPGKPLSYYVTVAKRAIWRAATQGYGGVAASHLIRARAARVGQLRRQGLDEGRIREQLRLTRGQVAAAVGVYRPMQALPHDSPADEQEPYDLLADLLACPKLDDQEQSLLQLLTTNTVAQVARMATIPATTLRRRCKRIKRKLMAGGYGS